MLFKSKMKAFAACLLAASVFAAESEWALASRRPVYGYHPYYRHQAAPQVVHKPPTMKAPEEQHHHVHTHEPGSDAPEQHSYGNNNRYGHGKVVHGHSHPVTQHQPPKPSHPSGHSYKHKRVQQKTEEELQLERLTAEIEANKQMIEANKNAI